MLQVSIAQNALLELRERMAKYQGSTEILIMGPMEDDSRAPDSVEEAWMLERLYGPPQRWVLDMLPPGVVTQIPVESREMFHSQDVDGLHITVVTTKTVDQLRIELHGDSIRVFEPHA